MALQYDELVKAQTEKPVTYGQQGQVITLDQMQPVPSVTVPSPDYTTINSSAGSLVSGVETANKTLANYIKQATPAPTTTETSIQDILNSYVETTKANTGREAYQIEQQNALKVPEFQTQIADLNTQIQTGLADLNKMDVESLKAQEALQNQPMVSKAVVSAQTSGLQRTQALERAAKSSEIALLQARQLGLNGQLQTALSLADKAVELKYKPIEDELKVKEAQLKALEPLYNAEQKIRAEARQRMYDDEKQKIADEKEKAKANLNLALENNVKTKFVNKNGEFFDVNSGVAFPDAQSFFKASGVNSFEEAYYKGLVTDVSPNKLTFTTENVDGNQVRFGFDQTGKIVSKVVLGKVKTGSGTGVKTTLKEDIQSMQQEISTVIGKDGYISPENWKVALKNWQDAGYSAASFKTNFQNYINPADPQDYK